MRLFCRVLDHGKGKGLGIGIKEKFIRPIIMLRLLHVSFSTLFAESCSQFITVFYGNERIVEAILQLKNVEKSKSQLKNMVFF